MGKTISVPQSVAVEMPPVSAGRGLQAEKSASMRARILESAIEGLVEVGYSSLTTVEIAERAGVSRGAMLHHYKSKADILSATMEYLHEKRIEELRRSLSRLDEELDVVDAAVNLLWGMVKHPHFYAMQELTVAARTDPELRETLLPLAKRFEQEIFHVNEEIFRGYVRRGSPFEAMRDLARFVFEGLGTWRILHEDDQFAEQTLAMMKELIRAHLLDPAKSGRRSEGGRGRKIS